MARCVGWLAGALEVKAGWTKKIMTLVVSGAALRDNRGGLLPSGFGKSVASLSNATGKLARLAPGVQHRYAPSKHVRDGFGAVPCRAGSSHLYGVISRHRKEANKPVADFLSVTTERGRPGLNIFLL